MHDSRDEPVSPLLWSFIVDLLGRPKFLKELQQAGETLATIKSVTSMELSIKDFGEVVIRRLTTPPPPPNLSNTSPRGVVEVNC